MSGMPLPATALTRQKPTPGTRNTVSHRSTAQLYNPHRWQRQSGHAAAHHTVKFTHHVHFQLAAPVAQVPHSGLCVNKKCWHYFSMHRQCMATLLRCHPIATAAASSSPCQGGTRWHAL